jgi:hypothetical protein
MLRIFHRMSLPYSKHLWERGETFQVRPKAAPFIDVLHKALHTY